jgi:hypothetical protein
VACTIQLLSDRSASCIASSYTPIACQDVTQETIWVHSSAIPVLEHGRWRDKQRATHAERVETAEARCAMSDAGRAAALWGDVEHIVCSRAPLASSCTYTTFRLEVANNGGGWWFMVGFMIRRSLSVATNDRRGGTSPATATEPPASRTECRRTCTRQVPFLQAGT